MSETMTVDGEIIEAPPETTAVVPAEAPLQTIAQARIDSVARMLDAAYQRASLLELTDEESSRLTADFGDDDVRAGAKGNQDLLYIEAASIRRRLLTVFGPGRWVPVCRRIWTEEYATQKGKAIRVYTDVVLLIRGCYVGEAIGAGSYFPNNPSQDYSDASEAGQSEALRRICGKTLGVGLQVWNKMFCESWKARRKLGPPQSVCASITPGWVDNIRKWLKHHGESEVLFCRSYGVASLELLPKACIGDDLRTKLKNGCAAWKAPSLRSGPEETELKHLYQALADARCLFTDVADKVKLPSGVYPTVLTPEQYKLVMDELRKHAPSMDEQHAADPANGAQNEIPF